MNRGGRVAAGNSLSLAAIIAMRRNNPLAAFHGRCRQAGKPLRVTIKDSMRKLIVLTEILPKAE